MYDTHNVKFFNAQIAKQRYKCKNIKEKLNKNNAAIWYKKVNLVGSYYTNFLYSLKYKPVMYLL